MRDYLKDKPVELPIWPGTWATRSADMFKLDLERAGIPYAVEGPHGPEYADFHALRHSFITMLERAGISPKTAQAPARHSDVRLTLQRYTHKTLHDLGTAVEAFPSVLPTVGRNRQALSATGTEGANSLNRLHSTYTPLTQTPDSGAGRMRTGENGDGSKADPSGPSEVVKLSTVEDGRGRLRSPETERAGFEPAVGFDPHAALAKRSAGEGRGEREDEK